MHRFCEFAVNWDKFKNLHKSDRVTFEVEKGKRGSAAKNVTRL